MAKRSKKNKYEEFSKAPSNPHKRAGGPVRNCARKSRYKSEKFAKEIAKKRRAASGVQLRVYHCPMCQSFHLTKAQR